MSPNALALIRSLSRDMADDLPQGRAYDFMDEKWINETGSQEGVSERGTGCIPEAQAGFADDLLHGTAKALRPGRVDETETGANFHIEEDFTPAANLLGVK